MSSSLEAFREYDEMVQQTIEATERANALRDTLAAARLASNLPITSPVDEVILSPYTLDYVSPLSRRRLSTPQIWKSSDASLPLSMVNNDRVTTTFGTSPLSSSLSSLSSSPSVSPASTLRSLSVSPTRRSQQRRTVERLSNEKITKSLSLSPTHDRDLLRYRPLVQGDSVCGELLVFGFAGSNTIDHGLQKRLPRNVGLNSRLSRALSGKLNWGRAYIVLDPSSELLACYSSRGSSKAIKIIRLRGANLISIGRKKKQTGNSNGLSMFCWIINEARDGNDDTKNNSFTFGVPSSDVARMWTHALRFTITQQKERDSLMEQRQRGRDRLTHSLSSPKNISNRFKIAPLANSWEVPLHDVEQCSLPGTDITTTTGELLKEMGFAVVQDLYKGKIIGMTLDSIPQQASVRIQSFIRGCKERSHLGMRRGRKGKFARKRSTYHQAIKNRSGIPVEARHLRPKKPYEISVHMERLLAFAPRTSRNASKKIQSMVRGVVARKRFLRVFTIQRNNCCSIQGWFRLCTKRWRRKQQRSATCMQKWIRRWIAQRRLQELRIETLDFIQNIVVCYQLMSYLDKSLSKRLVQQWLRTQICLLRMRRWRRSVKKIEKFWRNVIGCRLRQFFRTAVKAVVRVQAAARRIKQVKEYRAKLGDAHYALRKLIAWWRSHKPRIAARMIQSIWRMYRGGRPFHAAKKAAMILITRYRGWSCVNTYKRQLAAAVIIESCTRRLIAQRQVRLSVWQIVRIQTQFRVRKARAQLKGFQHDVISRQIQSWWRGVMALGDFKLNKENQIVISRWWTGLRLLSKLRSAVTIARHACTIIQTSVRGFIARDKFCQNELMGLQEFVELETRLFSQTFRTTGFSANVQPAIKSSKQKYREKKRREQEQEQLELEQKQQQNNPTKKRRKKKRRRALGWKTESKQQKELTLAVMRTGVPYVAIAQFNSLSLRLDRILTHDNQEHHSKDFIQDEDEEEDNHLSIKYPLQVTVSQCPHVQTSSVTLRELSLAVLVHPWLRRHRLGVQKLIKTLAASPQLFETNIIIKGSNHDMQILDSSLSKHDNNSVLMTALEEYPIRLPRSIADSLLKIGHYQVSQMTVADFVHYAGRDGEKERTLRDASRTFMNNLFTTDFRQMQADQRQTTLQTLTDPKQRAVFDQFLSRMSLKFGSTFQIFQKLDKIGSNLLDGFATSDENDVSLHSLQTITQPPHLLYRISKRMSKFRMSRRSASESFAVHDDAGAYFLTKQIVEFIDAFVTMEAEWNITTPDKCKQLESRVYALSMCIPLRYRWTHSFKVSSSIVALDSALGSLYYERASFIPIFLECLDALNKLGAVQSCWQNDAIVKEEKIIRDRKEKQFQAMIAKRGGSDNSGDDSDNNSDASDDNDTNSADLPHATDEASVITSTTGDQEDEEMTADLFILLEHENSQMTAHLSNLQQYVSPTDVNVLRNNLFASIPNDKIVVSYNFSIQMQSVLTNWVRDSASKMDFDHPKHDFLLNIPFQMAAIHTIMELWETSVERPATETMSPVEQSHMDTQFMSTICDQLIHIGECMKTIDAHQTRCAAQQKRCVEFMSWVHDERSRCVKHCEESRRYLQRCKTIHDQAAHVVKVANLFQVAPLERPDGVDEKRVTYFESAVVMNSAAFEAATIELNALEETLKGIRNSNDDCGSSLDRIRAILYQQSSWLEHSTRLHQEIMLRFEDRVPEIEMNLEKIQTLETEVEAVDRVQLVRAATRALDDFEEGEQRRNELLTQKETCLHNIRAQARIFRKHSREYLVHLWLALNKNSTWYSSWETEFHIKLEIPCTKVEANISVLYDQVKLAQELNREKVEALKIKAEVCRAEWHTAEELVSNFWWFKFAEGNCVWFEKWQRWHHSIRHEKKVFEDRKKLLAKAIKAQELVVETNQAAVAIFQPGDVVDAKCKGWHQWWVGEVRRVDDPNPGSGKFTYYLKFQDGERIRGIEERRLRPPVNKPPDQGLFALAEESIAATSDYTNDSLGNPGSEESDFYFETDSDIPPVEQDTEDLKDNNDNDEQKKKNKADRKRRKEEKKKKKHAKQKEMAKKNQQTQEEEKEKNGYSSNDNGTGDEMSEDDSGEESDSSEEEVDPLQLVLDRAIEFAHEFPNAGPRDIPWEKLFTENGFVYQEWEAERLERVYNFRKLMYFPVEKVEKIIDVDGAEVQSVGSIPSTDGYAPLLIAAHQGDFNKVRMIVDAGANINMTAEDGETPLIAAARNGHEALVRLLIEMGAIIDKVKSSTDESAALIARRAGHENVVVLLYELGAKHVQREREKIRWFGHRKMEGMVVSETESERSSDRHSWDLDEDHPLEFEHMFKPVSVRRKNKKDARRREKIADRMRDTPLTESERKDLIFSSTRRTALQQWDTIETAVNASSKEARQLETAIQPPFKPEKWDRLTKQMTKDPILLLPERQRNKLLDALKCLHNLRLAVEWRDYPLAQNLATQTLKNLETANVPMNKAGGVMQFAGGIWDTLEPIDLSTLSQIASAVPTIKELLDDLQVKYDTDILEHEEPLIDIGKLVDPSKLNATDVKRLSKIFDRLAKLPKIVIQDKTKKELKEDALKAEAAKASGRETKEEVKEVIKPKNRTEIEAEEAAKLAAAPRNEKVLLNSKIIIRAVQEFTKRTLSISAVTMRYFVRHRYASNLGQITWEEFVDCATTNIPSRLAIRRMYHVGRIIKTQSNMRERFLKWARSVKHKIYLKYGQDLPMFRYIKEKVSATKIQNWFRCLQEYYGFLKQKYVFDSCKHVQEAAMTLQNFFWSKFSVVVMKERVVRDFVMVYDPESKGTFYVDKTVMAGRMYLPDSVKGCIRDYTNSTRFTNPITICALRPWQLNDKAEMLNFQEMINTFGSKIQKILEKRKGQVLDYDELHLNITLSDETAEPHVDAIIKTLVSVGILEFMELTGRYRVDVKYHESL